MLIGIVSGVGRRLERRSERCYASSILGVNLGFKRRHFKVPPRAHYGVLSKMPEKIFSVLDDDDDVDDGL